MLPRGGVAVMADEGANGGAGAHSEGGKEDKSEVKPGQLELLASMLAGMRQDMELQRQDMALQRQEAGGSSAGRRAGRAGRGSNSASR